MESGKVLLPIYEALLEGGATALKITMTSPDAITTIAEASREFASRALMGVGTVLDTETCLRYGKLKLFPADGLGPKYIQNLLAPLPMLRIVPNGGVTVETAGDFLKAGCAALATGSSLVAKEFVQNQDWAGLTARATAFVAAVQKARGK